MQPEPTPGSVTPAAPPPPSPRPRPLRRVGATVGVIFLAAALFVGGVAADRAGLVPLGPGAATASADADLALVDQAWTLLREHYVDRSTVDWRQIAYGAIGGMTQAIGDTGHTTFLTPQDLNSLQAELSGSYVGIGAVIDMSNGQPEIVSVFQGSSAAKAGLGHGDLIISIDGVDTTGMTLPTVGSRIRGKAGTTVTLVVAASANGPTRTVTVTRAKVEVPAVSWTMVPGTTVADIQIAQFSTGASDAFGKALDAATQAGASAILLDLRDNPGGYTDEVRGVASRLLASGVVYITQDASGKKTAVSVRSGVQATSLPIVALVNQATASAAEILAGALQDHDRAPVVGVTTFGTGTVLLQYTLADGSALEIGTEKWLTPSGHQIWHHGITPDHVVALPSGTQPVTPDALRSMTAAGVAASGDVQLQAGLSLLTGGS